MWVWAHARHIEEALEGVACPKKLLERLRWVPVERVTSVCLWGWGWWCWWPWWCWWCWWWYSPPPPPPLLVLSPSSPNLSYTSLFFLSLSTWPIKKYQPVKRQHYFLKSTSPLYYNTLSLKTVSSPRKHKQYPWTFRPRQETCSGGGKIMLRQQTLGLHILVYFITIQL